MRKILVIGLLITFLVGCQKEVTEENTLACSSVSELSGVKTVLDAEYTFDDNDNILTFKQTSTISGFASEEIFNRYIEGAEDYKIYYQKIGAEYSFDTADNTITSTLFVRYEYLDETELKAMKVKTKLDAINYMEYSNAECNES